MQTVELRVSIAGPADNTGPGVREDLADAGTTWGGLAIFAATGRGTRALALGWNARSFAAVADWFGGEVVYLDWPRPMADRADTGASRASIPPPSTLPLAFEDASFDTVFLSGALEWAAAFADGSTSVRQAQEQLLQECRRLLRPGGMLLALVENRFSITALGGAKHPITGLRWFDFFPRTLEFALPARVREAARRYQPHSRSGWEGLFRIGGFEPENWRTLWPTSTNWREALPLSQSSLGRIAKYGGSAYKRHLADGLLRALSALRSQDEIAPTYLVAARPGEMNSTIKRRASLVEEIIAAEGESASARVIVSSLLSSRCLCFTVGKTFYKVPLDAPGRSGTAHEAAAAARLAEHPVARHVPLPVRMADVQGVSYLACPAVHSSIDRGISEEDVAEFLEALHQDSIAIKLSDTEFWARSFRPDVRASLSVLGGGPLLNYLAHALGDRTVRVGIAHGDLHLKNVMPGSDRLFAVDWADFREMEPQFFDVFNIARALLAARRRDRAGSFRALAELALKGDRELPLRRYLLERDDELAIPELLFCWRINSMSKRIIKLGPNLSTTQNDLFRQTILFYEQILNIHPGPFADDPVASHARGC